MNWIIICAVITYIIGIYITYAILRWKFESSLSAPIACSFMWPFFFIVLILKPFIIPFKMIDNFIENKKEKQGYECKRSTKKDLCKPT